MKNLIVPAAALICLASAQVAIAQGLPPTNMGKFVHTPGDNQYASQAQNERHGPPPTMAMPAASAGGGGGGYSAPRWTPAPRPFRPDPSIQPIAADEPVAQSYFPPLPDRLDLPVQLSMSGGIGAAGFHSTYQGAAPSNSNGYASTQGAMHPGGYEHYDPGAFIPQGTKRSGYKCLPDNETFSTHGGGPIAGGGGGGASTASPTAAALRSLGHEPKLNNDGRDGAQAPDAPTPVVVNQATTQDLSYPEDEFDFRRPNNGRGNNFLGRAGSQLGNRVRGMGQMMTNNMFNMGGMGGGMGNIHF